MLASLRLRPYTSVESVEEEALCAPEPNEMTQERIAMSPGASISEALAAELARRLTGLCAR